MRLDAQALYALGGWGGVQVVNIAMDSSCVLIANQNETITTMTVAVEVKPTRSRMIPRGTPVWSKKKDGSNLFVYPKWDGNVCLNGVLANDVRFNKGDEKLKEIAVVTGGVVSVRMDKGVDTRLWKPYLIICDNILGECRLVLNHAVRALDVSKGEGSGRGSGDTESGAPKEKSEAFEALKEKISNKRAFFAGELDGLADDKFAEIRSLFEKSGIDGAASAWDTFKLGFDSADKTNDLYKNSKFSFDDLSTGLLASFAAKMPVSRSTAKKKAAVKKTAKAAMRK